MVAITNTKKPVPTDLRNWWWWVKYLPWCCLSFWSVACHLFLFKHKSNLDAVGRVIASGHPGMQTKQLIVKRKKKEAEIVGSRNLWLVWGGEVPKGVHAVNRGGRSVVSKSYSNNSIGYRVRHAPPRQQILPAIDLKGYFRTLRDSGCVTFPRDSPGCWDVFSRWPLRHRLTQRSRFVFWRDSLKSQRTPWSRAVVWSIWRTTRLATDTGTIGWSSGLAERNCCSGKLRGCWFADPWTECGASALRSFWMRRTLQAGRSGRRSQKTQS